MKRKEKGRKPVAVVGEYRGIDPIIEHERASRPGDRKGARGNEG